MAMELQIMSPKPGQKFPTIKWNNEELKKEITETMSAYQNIVVTPETEKDSRDLRAKLNKLRTALETARKDMKKRANEPIKIFEAQVKEVEEPIDTAIANLDKQLDEIKQAEQEKKRHEICEAYNNGDYPVWLSLEQIWDDRWLNKSVSVQQVKKDITEKVRQINGNLQTIEALPEFAFEAADIYRRTLDFGEAVRRAKEMAEVAKRKAEAEKALSTNQQNGEQDQVSEAETHNTHVEPPKSPVEPSETEQPKVYTFRFEISVTAAQAQALGNFCREQGFTLTRIQ